MIKMGLITTSELSKHVGFRGGALDQGGILAQIIADAELEIGARLLRYNLSMPASSDILKPAVMKLSEVGVARRELMEKSRPMGLHSAEYSVPRQIDALKQEAWDIVNSYIRENSTYEQYRFFIRKSN
jgi:hypothetical protein